MNEPKRCGTVFLLFIAAICAALIVYFPDKLWIVFPALIGLVSGVSAMFLWLEWLLVVIENQHRERRMSDAITPTSEAAKAVRWLTPEQVAAVPRWEHMLRVGHILEPAGASDFLITDDAVIPYSFICDFLERSSFTKLDKIGNYSDKTEGREYAQALTEELAKRGYALPAKGNEPALWVSADSRSRFAQEMGVELGEGA